jgi:hypothetical protein
MLSVRRFLLLALSICSTSLSTFTACETSLNVTISFGGPFWPIAPQDMNLGPIDNGLCLGGIFILNDYDLRYPDWILGDVFLVSFVSLMLLHSSLCTRKMFILF